MLAYAAAEDIARNFVAKINDVILFPLISLMSGIALLFFLYGVFEYIKGAGSAEAHEKGQKHILWGIVGLLIMVSAYAILTIAANTVGVGGELQSTTVR